MPLFSTEWSAWMRTVKSSARLFTHSCAITITLCRERESLSDTHVWDSSHTKPYFFPLHPFQVRQHIKRAPQPGFGLWQITWCLHKVCVQLHDTKQQRFANSRLCDVHSFYSLPSCAECLSLRQCQLVQSVIQSAKSVDVLYVWFWLNCCNAMVYHL